jgi:hypothetical protein
MVNLRLLEQLQGSEFRLKLNSLVGELLNDPSPSDQVRQGYSLAHTAIDYAHILLEGGTAYLEVTQIAAHILEQLTIQNELEQLVVDTYLKWYTTLNPLDFFLEDGRKLGRAQTAHHLTEQELIASNSRSPQERHQMSQILFGINRLTKQVSAEFYPSY